MKKYYILLLLIVILYTNKSYSKWEQYGLDSSIITSNIIVGNKIFIGTTNGLYLSQDSCMSWNNVNIGQSNVNITSLALLNNNIYLASYGYGIYLSTDIGNSWNTINIGLSNLNVRFLEAFGDYIFALSDFYNILLSTNNGNNWNVISNQPIDYEIMTLFVSDSTFLLGSTGGIYLTTNNGKNWNKKLSCWTSRCFVKINNKIFSGTDDMYPYVSTNNGNDWNNISNLYGTSIYSLYLNNNIIYAGTKGTGIYYSSDIGNNWDSLAVVGLTDQTILTMFKLGNFLYLGTSSLGLCRIYLKDTTDTSVPEPQNPSTELTISPNPASDILNINGNINNYPIKIYNIEGIKQIEAENTKEIDISKLPQGVYYIQIGNYFTKFVKILK